VPATHGGLRKPQAPYRCTGGQSWERANRFRPTRSRWRRALWDVHAHGHGYFRRPAMRSTCRGTTVTVQKENDRGAGAPGSRGSLRKWPGWPLPGDHPQRGGPGSTRALTCPGLSKPAPRDGKKPVPFHSGAPSGDERWQIALLAKNGKMAPSSEANGRYSGGWRWGRRESYPCGRGGSPVELFCNLWNRIHPLLMEETHPCLTCCCVNRLPVLADPPAAKRSTWKLRCRSRPR